MPGMSNEEPAPCPDCAGTGVGRYGNGLGGQRVQCSKCDGSGQVMVCSHCGAGPDEECLCDSRGEDSRDPDRAYDGRVDREPRGFGEAAEHDPLIEPGAKNHPEDCECPVCTERGPKNEGFSFDKFMEGTLLKEHREKKVDATEVSPQRRIARNYQERPLGRIRFGKKVL